MAVPLQCPTAKRPYSPSLGVFAGNLHRHILPVSSVSSLNDPVATRIMAVP